MVVGCQPHAPAAFTPRKYSWYLFMLEAESTPEPQSDRKDLMIQNIWTLLYIPSPYRAVNTLRLGYKNQSVNAV